MNFKPRDSKAICSSLSCVFDRVAWLNAVLYLTGEGRGILLNDDTLNVRELYLLLNEIIFGWSWIIIFVEWNYFWLKFNKYFCWMKITWVEVEQILLLNETIIGWSWIIIFVEWYYFWLKLNNYFRWMKLFWVELEQILLLNENNLGWSWKKTRIVEYKYKLSNIISCWT